MPRSQQTLNRYMSIYNKIQTTATLAEVSKWSFSTFRQKTGLRTESQFRLARSIARNKDLQRELNIELKRKAIPRAWIKPIKVKEYMPKVRLLKEKLTYKPFKRDIPKFRSVKGLKTEIKSKPLTLHRDIRKALKEVLSKAQRQTQKFSGKQIKINITSDIIPNKKLDKDFREVSSRSTQTKARMLVADLDDDIDDIMDDVSNYIAEYDPSGNIVISITIVNYTV